jgi:hypothetical protein
MPRKVDPRQGEDGYESEPEPLVLDEDAMRELADLLGMDENNPAIAQLRTDVEDIGNAYRRWQGRGAGAFSRADARAALKALSSQDHIDSAAVWALNGRALDAMHNELLMMKPSPLQGCGTIVEALDRDLIDEDTLRRAAKDAANRFKAIKGSDRDGELAWAVAELCRLYERLTGERATLSNKGKLLAYVQEPRSKAGRFVSACFGHIDETVLPSKISEAMRHFIARQGNA